MFFLAFCNSRVCSLRTCTSICFNPLHRRSSSKSKQGNKEIKLPVVYNRNIFHQSSLPSSPYHHHHLCFCSIPFTLQNKIRERIQVLTRWDSIAGDGDCGTTFKRGAEALIAALDASHLPKADLCALLRALSERFATLVCTMWQER